MATTKHRPNSKARPIPATLPPHIEERDEAARRAELTVEHEWWNQNSSVLVSCYRGPVEVLLASPFIVDREAFVLPTGMRHPVKACVADFCSPTHVVGVFREEGEGAVVKYRDSLPDTFGTLEGGSIFYRYHDGYERVEYVGTREALLADAIVTEGDIPECPPEFDRLSHAAKESASYRLRPSSAPSDGVRDLVDCYPLGQNRFRAIVHPGAREKAQQEGERLAAAAAFASADDFRNVALVFADAGIVAMLAALEKTGQGADGSQYRLPKSLLDRVMQLAAQIRIEIAGAQVNVQRKAPEPLQEPTVLPPDQAFHRFITGLMPR